MITVKNVYQRYYVHLFRIVICCCTYKIVECTILLGILIVLFSFRGRLILSVTVVLSTILRKYHGESLPDIKNTLYCLRIKLDDFDREQILSDYVNSVRFFLCN